MYRVMRKALACPDKFKGTLSAADAAAAMGRGLGAAGFDVGVMVEAYSSLFEQVVERR